MKNQVTQIDRKILKSLEPLNRLNPILLDELAAKSIIEEVPADRTICRHGEKDSRQIYLLSGQVEVATPGQTKTKILKSKTPLVQAIAQGTPRTETLKSRAASKLLYIDADLLELLMSDIESPAGIQVEEINSDGGDDWMMTFLQSPAFLQLPTENIQKLLTHMEEIQVKKDQVIINQGGKDDNYYIIKSGSANVNRKPYAEAANVLLAVLNTGSGFGEEALITNGVRNATITMRENGSLMRLKKKDFLELLIHPLIPYFEAKDLQTKMNSGAMIMDVRPEKASQANPVDKAVNIPLSMIRLEFDNLNPEREYLLVCEDSSQSDAAAFLMIQQGFKCSVLKGGLKNSGLQQASKQQEVKAQPAAAKPASQAQAKAAAEKARQEEKAAKAKQQLEAARQQSEKIAQQAKAIKDARLKAERDIEQHKKELTESRARIAQENQQLKQSRSEAAQLKQKAEAELRKAQQEAKENEARQSQAHQAIQQAEQLIKQSTEAAALATQKAEMEAAAIKQRALEEAEYLKAEVEATREKIAREAKLAAEKEAEEIKQRALEEAMSVRAEMEATKQALASRTEQLKHEETIIKQSALKMRNEADQIRKEAMSEAEQVRKEVEATRAILNNKLQQAEEEEKQKRLAILEEARIKAEQLAQEKTNKAVAEAEAIKEQARVEAERLQQELEQTRNQIKAEAEQVISRIKQESEQAKAEQTQVIQQATIQKAEMEKQAEVAKQQQQARDMDQTMVAESPAETEFKKPNTEKDIDYKSVSIPGMQQDIDEIDLEASTRIQAENIKRRLEEKHAASIEIVDNDYDDDLDFLDSDEFDEPAAVEIKVHKKDDKTILEGDEDLFIYKEPEVINKVLDQGLTNIETTPTNAASATESMVIYPEQEQESLQHNNPFLNNSNDAAKNQSSKQYLNKVQGRDTNIELPSNGQEFNKQAFQKRQRASSSNTFAIAASFILIVAGALFTLHATDTLKMQSIAALFNSGNENQAATKAIAKTKPVKEKVLKAQSKVTVKKKVGNEMDNIMNGWQNMLKESANPKKLKQDEKK